VDRQGFCEMTPLYVATKLNGGRAKLGARVSPARA